MEKKKLIQFQITIFFNLRTFLQEYCQLTNSKTGQKYTGPTENVVVTDLGEDVSGNVAEQVEKNFERLQTNYQETEAIQNKD